MRCGRAAGADQHEIARIESPFDGDTADAIDHVVVYDRVDAIGGLFDGQVQRVSDFLDRRARFLEV